MAVERHWGGGCDGPSLSAGWSALIVPRPGFLLAGTLDRASSSRPAPVILILPAGGPVDADGNTRPAADAAGNGVSHSPYAQLARSLARHGYAAARFGKGGPAGSMRGRWRAVEERADDCAAMADALRSQGLLEGRTLVLMGHGEGGLVALAAARAAGAAALILLGTPAQPADELVARQLRSSRTPEPETGGRRSRMLEESLRRFRTRLLLAPEGSGVEYAGRTLPPAAARYLKSLYAIDPAALAASVDVEALVVEGGSDSVVPPGNGATLASALPRGDLRVLEGMTHGLALAGSACGSAPVTPLHPLLVWTILAWLERVAPRGDAEPAGLCPVSAPVPAPSPPRGP